LHLSSSAAPFVVAFGAFQAITSLLKAIVTGHALEIEGRLLAPLRHFNPAALEFAFAADILRTAVAPTWDYFLAKDIQPLNRAAPRIRPPSRARKIGRIQAR